jgi:putative DNA primase/helicase
MFDAIFSPMGVTTDHQFVYYIRATKSVRSLSAHQHNTRMNLLAMAREDQWWATINKLPANVRSRVVGVRKVGKGGTEAFIDWCSLAAEMMDLCREIGRFDPSKVRGRGLWRRSTGELVYNTGAQLFVMDRDEMHTLDLAELKVTDTDPHRYVAHPSQLAPPSKDEATPDESRRILDLLNRMPWENGLCGQIAMGWIACATVLNLLDFRPHVAVTAELGAGKSKGLLRIVQLALGKSNCIFVEANKSTEPGIRQTLGSDALPIICDEFETTRPGTRSIIEFFRSASNPEAGDIVKGTPEGRPLLFQSTTIALVAGIVITFEEPADAARFATLELNKVRHTNEQREAFKADISRIDPAFGPRLQRRMINRWEQFLVNKSRFCGIVLDKGGDDRAADLYGNLLAGYWTATHDAIVTEDEAAELLDGYDPHRYDDQDHASCLAHLLAYRLWPEGETIGDLLTEVITDKPGNSKHDSAKSLNRFGIRYSENSKEVIIANRTPEIRSCFSGTPWANGQHARVFKRMDGHDGGNKTVRFGTTLSKATYLPHDMVLPGIADDG